MNSKINSYLRLDSFQKIIHFGSSAIVPVCYGYIGGAMVEAFFTKGRAPVLLKTSEEEE